LKRFGMKELDEDTIALMRKRVIVEGFLRVLGVGSRWCDLRKCEGLLQ
jgi:hypothetical protein